MTIDIKTVQDIARLARLELDSSQTDKYANELNNILQLVEQMNEVDTDSVKPMTHPFDATLRMRTDEVKESNKRESLQAHSPSTEKGLFLVPKVID